MIQEFVDRFMENKAALRAEFEANEPGDYEEIVKAVVEAISTDEVNSPDPNGVIEIPSNDCQGTNLYIIKNKYENEPYWAVMVHYGTCSGCDTLEGIKDNYYDDLSKRLDGYMTLALHIVQKMKKLELDGV
jgi:hypothetical protein